MIETGKYSTKSLSKLQHVPVVSSPLAQPRVWAASITAVLILRHSATAFVSNFYSNAANRRLRWKEAPCGCLQIGQIKPNRFLSPGGDT